MKLLLASQSPRRKELLASLGYEFQSVSIDCDEVYPADLPAENVAAYLSELKAKAYGDLHENEILITADTVVAIDGEILGKPKNTEEAKAMLSQLSGNKHQVYTAVSVGVMGKIITETDVAEVEFLPISEDEINFYISQYQPMDKAGSYGIQEWLGMAKISRINGSFYTIMGLPTHIIYRILKEIEGKI
ncbi:MAG: Maf family protein [Bergeyella zoohelcum]|nr:Maf family protein [Bergeyella zoohelcum]